MASVTVKVFYEKLDGQKEIRRFPVSTSPGFDSFSAIKDKVKELYDALAHGNFKLFWQDPDGDRVAFSTTEELKEALGFVSNDKVLRVYITETKEEIPKSTPKADPGSARKTPQPQPSEERQKPQATNQEKKKPAGKPTENQGAGEEQPFHRGVTCDGCEGPIYGIRFKCCVCPDYDLCSSCEGNGMHNEHDMYKINKPRMNPFAFLPPHIGRHVHRCMRMGANGGQSSSASANAESSSQSSSNDDYLNKIGANIAAFLDPFGIDVTYDVHNNGQHQSGGWGRGGCGSGRSSGCGSKSSTGGFGSGAGAGFGAGAGWGFCPAYQDMEKRYASEKKGEKTTGAKETEMETDSAPKSPAPNASGDAPMTEERREKSPASGKKNDGSEDWTFVSDQEAHMESADPNCPIPMPAPSTQQTPIPMPAPPTSTATSSPLMTLNPSTAVDSQGDASQRSNTGTNIYPNLQIQQSLEQMLSMGFTNNGNWLTDLLVEYDGDIGMTLDAIKAKATQQLDSLRGGNQ